MQFFTSFLTGVVLFYSFRYFPFSTCFIFLSSSAFFVTKKRFLVPFIILCGILFAFLRYQPSHDIHFPKEPVTVKGIFSSSPVRTTTGSYLQNFRLESAEDFQMSGNTEDFIGKDIILFSDSEFEPGREYELSIKFPGNRTRHNPGWYNSGDVYARILDILHSGIKSISLHARIQDYRNKINRYFEENFDEDSSAFLSSLTTGKRTNMDEELRDAFNATGLAHILSISGTHFGLFSILLFGIFRFFIKMLPYSILRRITIFLTPSQAAALLCFPFMLAYLGLSGAGIPAVRSFIMISLFLFGLLIHRKGFWLNSLLFAACVLVIWDPQVIFDLSFQLSFLAVLCIGFSIEHKDNAKDDDITGANKVLSHLKKSLLITFSASIGTAPLVAYYFHYFSIISPFTNLLIAPLIGFILIPLSVMASFVYLLSGHFFLTKLISAVSGAGISCVRWLSDIPFADIKIPAFPPILIILFYTGIIFYLLFRKRYILILPFVPILVYIAVSGFDKREMAVTFLDVGQGDSAVAELPDGKTLLIDTGINGRETVSFLKYRGITTVDATILSHVHPDHTGGLDYLAKRMKVKEIWDNGRAVLPSDLPHMTHRSLQRGDFIEGNGYSIYALHPYPAFYTLSGNKYTSANNDSLVLRIKGRHASFLFSGDIEEEAEENIQHLGEWVKCDILKVPHHGSKTSAYRPLLDMILPDIAVISVGRDNTFGHPHQETLDVLQGVRVFRTDADGAVKISETPDGIAVRTYKDFQFDKASSFHDELKNLKRLFQKW